jgi:MFS transporter, DHA2 family, methylenomycin A resistance protein
MKMRAFESAAIVGGSVNVVNFGLLFCLGLYYGGTHGYSALKSGVLFLPMMVCTGISTMVVERIRRALGDRATVITGLLLELAGAILIGDRPGSAAWVSASTSFIGLGVGLVVPPITTGLLRSVDPKVSGVASGAFSSIRQFGSALGVAVLGLMVHGGGSSVRVELRPISVVCGVLLVIALTTYTISSGLGKKAASPVLQDNQAR